MRWLNYQHLFYFWHVARAGSVTRASEQLRLAQPTISAQLKTLEEVLGAQLLAREGRSVKLTEAGQLAYRYAEQIFNMGEELLDVLEGRTQDAKKDFRIGIADVVPKSLAYKLIEPAFVFDDRTTVYCFEDKTEKLLAQLSIAELDLVIADRPLPPSVKVKAFNHFIGRCGVSFLCDRKLASKYRKHFPMSLNMAPLLYPTDDSAIRRELENWLDKNNILPHVVGEFQDRALMKLAARSGQGIMLAPSVVEREIKKEFGLELIGRTAEIKEELYVISIERRLKNPLVLKIYSEGQRSVFAKSP